MFNSIIKIAHNRTTNSLYGTFFISWLVFHWNFIFSVIALDDSKIFQIKGILKNEYLLQRYFDFGDWYFWFSWIMPFLLTYLIIWKLPKWVLLDAYDKTEEYEVNKKIIRTKQQIKIEQEEVKLQEQMAKKTTAVAKQITEEKKIKEADPTISWNEDYERFKKLDFSYKFSKIIESYYKRQANIIDYDDYNNVVFEIPEDVLAYVHSNGIVDIDKNSNKIEMTEKGKYFINKFLEDPSKPTDLPF